MSETAGDENVVPESTPHLRYDDPNFHPLDHSQLNDFRRRIVSHQKDPDNIPDVTDEELRYAIQTLLYKARELDVKKSAPKKKAATKSKKLDPSVNFDDLLSKTV